MTDGLDDILRATAAIERHLTRGGLDDGMVYDAVRVRLWEIGEAVGALDATVLATEPTVPWREIAEMERAIARRYYDTTQAAVATIVTDLPALSAAVRRIRAVEEYDAFYGGRRAPLPDGVSRLRHG